MIRTSRKKTQRNVTSILILGLFVAVAGSAADIPSRGERYSVTYTSEDDTFADFTIEVLESNFENLFCDIVVSNPNFQGFEGELKYAQILPGNSYHLIGRYSPEKADKILVRIEDLLFFRLGHLHDE